MAEFPQRGIKRKRHEHKEEDVATKIAGKLHHDLKDVRKAAKKAKTFETQKLVKKVKGLRTKGDNMKEILDCEAQLEALKHTDHERIAHTALITKLKKDRLLSENPPVQTAISVQLSTQLLVSAAVGTPLSKVQSRLLSSKVLAAEVAVVIEDLKLVLQPKSETTAHEIEVQVNDHDTDIPLERPKKTKKAKGVQAIQTKQRAGSNNPDEDDGEIDEAGWESGSIGEEEDTAQDDWESGSVRSGRKAGSSSGSDSSSEEDLDEENEKPPRRSADKESTLRKAKSKASAAESTFLPNLSVGFIRGDSDSEWSDSEAKTTEVRKNRRGQRARRAIWDKKYGKNANHAKKQREMEVSGRHPGLARRGQIPKQGSGSGRQANSEGPPQHQPDAGWGKRNNAGVSSSATIGAILPRTVAHRSHHREERPLHPSWEAKKKQKEKQSAGILPPQGQKIKF